MDQLYTYQILQELKNKSFNDDWGLLIGIVIQAIVLYLTVIISVRQSRNEFERDKHEEERKRSVESKKMRNVITRNINKVIKQVSEEETKFYESFVEGYSIETGIRPVNILITFPELDMLNSIDRIVFENVFINERSSEQNINDLYFVLAGIESIKTSYKTLMEEISKINEFISNYDTVILNEHEKIKNFIIKRTIEYVSDKSNHYDALNNEINELITDINQYESEINNFSELASSLRTAEEKDIFKKIMEPIMLEYYQEKSTFEIYYLKYTQEVTLFHNRILYLIGRLHMAKGNLKLIETLS